jgi:outer membrane receptor protein involved in Fe transport
LKINQKVACAVTTILGGYAGTWAVAADTGTTAPAPSATSTTESYEIQEVVVTAQRREESLQDVPITVQAVTGEQLQQLNVSSFEDLVKYTPNVTTSANGPGAGNIFVRGLSSGGSGNQSQATTAPFTNVALYLDDESMQFPARNLDVYMVDMERVEVLEGPQGTLFGGGAQAGAIRYITNKPKLDVTEGDVNAGYGWTAGGDDNSKVNATINLPLIPDTLAVRAVIFDDHRGGYINNVPGTIASIVQPTVTASNGALVENDTNPVTYTGMRVSALWKINDDWNALVQQNFQNMEADGYFAEYPVGVNYVTPLPSYDIQAFAPAYDKDRYESTSWTLNGKIDDLLKLVYTGSYLDRHIQQQADYSNYLQSPSGQYYACTGKGSEGLGGTTKPEKCYAPVGWWNDTVETTHQSHEFRVSSNEDYRLRGLVGAYWEEFILKDQMNFDYLVIPQCDAANLAIANAGGPDCVSASGPHAGYYATDPGLRLNSDTAFGEDVKRGYRQTAFFASIDFDIIPKVLTITGGTRYFHYDEFEEGSQFQTKTVANDIPNGVCQLLGSCGFGINLGKTESGTRSRGNLTWHITPDTMVYYTFSQGFRPGGFNRTKTLPNGTVVLAGEAPFTSGGIDQYQKPEGYSSDNLINNEIGAKTEFLDHRIQLNASAYDMKWSNVQLPLFDPATLGNTTFVVNGPTYTVKGVELQLVARVTQGLTVQGSSSWNSSNQTNAPCLSSVGSAVPGNPTPAGQCITQVSGKPYTNPYGVLGTSPAFSPPMQFNLRARYDWTAGDYKPFAMFGASHIDAMRNEPASFPPGASSLCSPIPTTTLCLYTMPGYTTYDAAIGVFKDHWRAQVTAQNLSNSDASTFTSSGQYLKQEVPLRPRVVTLEFGYKF